MENKLSDPRTATRLPDQLPDDPMHWADVWLDDAQAENDQPNPNSMTLVTVNNEGRPSARVVLCKQFVANPGYLVFYTNYRSLKAREIEENADVAIVFHWDKRGRQIRLQGKAVKSPDLESDHYFATRHWGAQLGALGSDQSANLDSRDALITQIRDRASALGIALGENTQTLASNDTPSIQRPQHWGGFRVWAYSVELWKDGKDRIHDRALWTRDIQQTSDHDFSVSPWIGNRLQP